MKIKDKGVACRYWQTAFSPLAAISLLALITAPNVTYATEINDCDVVIVGGGAGGVHTAYRFATLSNNKGINPKNVCVFEKKNVLGGRIEDLPLGNGDGGQGGLIATGAMRMYKSHYTYALYKDVVGTNNTFQEQTKPRTILLGVLNPGGKNLGAVFHNNGEHTAKDFLQYYDLHDVPTGFDDDAAWALALCGKQVPLDNYNPSTGLGDPNYTKIKDIGGMSDVDYMKSVLNSRFGPKAFDWMQDTYAFKADFLKAADGKYQDAVSYMEFNANDWNGSLEISYPIPGHSRLINKMADIAKAKHVQFFMNEAVTKINKQQGARPYKIQTAKGNTVNAKLVIIATDPKALLDDIDGNIVDAITVQPEFKAAEQGHAIATQITNQWDVDWWDMVDKKTGEQFISYPGEKLKTDFVTRSGMTIPLSGGYCITRAELSNQQYWKDELVTRSAYIDDPDCAQKWQDLWVSPNGKAKVEAKLMEGLKILYPNVFDPAKNARYIKQNGHVPKMITTGVTIHPWAWNSLAQGSWNPARGSKITNQKVWDWSLDPLCDEKVYLVGDAYVVSNGWSASAYMSSARLLRTKFGMNVPLYAQDSEDALWNRPVATDPDTGTKYTIYPRIQCQCQAGVDSANHHGDCALAYPGY